MDHVRVHYGSSKPAQFKALAYAQVRDIHLAQCQENTAAWKPGMWWRQEGKGAAKRPYPDQ